MDIGNVNSATEKILPVEDNHKINAFFVVNVNYIEAVNGFLN